MSNRVFHYLDNFLITEKEYSEIKTEYFEKNIHFIEMRDHNMILTKKKIHTL